jgi:hypothetical protein
MSTVILRVRWRCPHYVPAVLLLVMLSCYCRAQTGVDSITGKLDPAKWAASINKMASSIEAKLISKSTLTLNRLQKQEEKIYRKMLRSKDSVQARASLNGIRAAYEQKRDQLKNTASITRSSTYISKLDSLTTTLKFLDQNGAGVAVQQALQKTNALRGKFSQTEEVQKFIRERKQLLKAQLEKLGIVKQLKKFNKEVYYYSAQVKEYKEILKDSKKREKKALELLSKTKLYKDFFRRNSQLATLFRLSGDPSDPSSAASLAGLQTRAQVNTFIQQQIAAGGPGASQQVSQNIQSAQAQLTQLKNKILKAGGSGSGDDLPGFKPNSQKTKSFLHRLEFGTNVQTQKASNYFPVTSDIGLSVGYKLSDKSVIGIGTSYKMGLGRGWRDLAITHQGIGLRSYVDIKLKGSFWISGGYEQNYRSQFNRLEVLQDLSAWQSSGLIGISKVISLKTKFFKKTKLQLLWDFLSYQQVPKVQPLLIRINYNLK